MGENPDELGKFTFAHARAGKGPAAKMAYINSLDRGRCSVKPAGQFDWIPGVKTAQSETSEVSKTSEVCPKRRKNRNTFSRRQVDSGRFEYTRHLALCQLFRGWQSSPPTLTPNGIKA